MKRKKERDQVVDSILVYQFSGKAFESGSYGLGLCLYLVHLNSYPQKSEYEAFVSSALFESFHTCFKRHLDKRIAHLPKKSHYN
ncbi:hypothetical protein PanWU01x14_335820 [Parasponia andersonii]|uniref:Uncharacterized protein n=1 Tax=Parasponia andersonii TaxID=3476 RepID=A0A2P5AG39_PARAD|nr:hypothetical protein PanWU01x14_335820 [Parasponia andersonii]